MFALLPFSAGSILDAAYLDLLLEAMEFLGIEQVPTAALYITMGFLGFFFLERFIYWYHGHVHENQSDVDDMMTVKRFVYLNLIEDGIHNLIDGMTIAASFLISLTMGLATTIAVIFHELPPEIVDFGVLVYGGFTRHKSLLFNFLSALTAIGVFFTNYFSIHIENLAGLLIALSTGGFIYLATSELIPEMQKENNIEKSMIQFLMFILGIGLIWFMGVIFYE